MQQAKFSLTDPLMEFLCNYRLYGFDNKSSMVREALLRLKQELELKQSADLYAEIYETKKKSPPETRKQRVKEYPLR